MLVSLLVSAFLFWSLDCIELDCHVENRNYERRFVTSKPSLQAGGFDGRTYVLSGKSACPPPPLSERNGIASQKQDSPACGEVDGRGRGGAWSVWAADVGLSAADEGSVCEGANQRTGQVGGDAAAVRERVAGAVGVYSGGE